MTNYVIRAYDVPRYNMPYEVKTTPDLEQALIYVRSYLVLGYAVKVTQD